MREFVVRFEGMAGTVAHGPTPPIGAFVKSWDAEAHDGRGDVEWTIEPSEALRFRSQMDAFEAWMTVPASRPTRPDGKDNRPFTAFTISVEPAPTE
jgi:hypothetical protein